MRRLVIAIDCDDVLIETTQYIVESYNRLYKTSVTLSRAYESGNDEWGVADKADLLKRLSDIQLSDEYAVIEPIEEAIHAVKKLARHHELHLVTARHHSVEALTLKMLDVFLPGVFTSVEHVGQDRPKGEICRLIGSDILVDDNAKHLVSALEHGMPAGGAIHFGDYAWNRHDAASDSFVSCASWDDVMREVQKIAGQ